MSDDQERDQDNTEPKDDPKPSDDPKGSEGKEKKPNSDPGKKPGDEKDAGKEAKPDLNYQLKPGKDSPLEAEAVKEIEAFAKANNLTKETAQAILQRESDKATSLAETQKKTLQETAKQWEKEIEEDKDLGGDKLKETRELASRVLDRFAPKEFLEDLKDSPFRNHPNLIRTLYNIGKAMSEDDLQEGAGTGGSDNKDNRPLHEKWYGAEGVKK